MALETSPPPTTITVERQSLARASISLVVPRLPTFVRRATEKAGLQTATSSSASSSRPPTPPPSYSETVSALLGPMKLSRLLPSSSAIPEDDDVPDPDSIQWKYANQGISLLTLSASESEPAGPSTPFSRQLYLHALTYLLRALPALNEEEAASLSAALPPSLAIPPTDADDFPIPTPRTRPWLQRLSAALTLRLFLLASLLLPVAQSGLAALVRLNRAHKLSDRALAVLLAGLAWTLAALGGLWRMQDGRLARLLEALASGVVASLSAGVYEGVGEGMAVVGLREDGVAVQGQTQGVARVKARELRRVRSHDTVRVYASPRKGTAKCRDW